MSNNEFGGYGSPMFPEPIGMAQEGLANIQTVPTVEPRMSGERNNMSEEEFLFEGYKAGVAGQPNYEHTLAQVTDVYDSGYVPPQNGAELIFVFRDGQFFNSVAETKRKAMDQGVLHLLTKNQ